MLEPTGEPPGSGSAEREAGEGRTTDDTHIYRELSWAPDGATLLLSVLGLERGLDEYTCRIYQMNADGSGRTPPTGGRRDYWRSWSPDGSRITYIVNDAGFVTVNLVRADGSESTTLLRSPAPAW